MPENVSEAVMLEALCRRYANSTVQGNGARWVTCRHVRSDAGFYSQRTADFVAVDTWPGGGNAIHGHEIKISRNDWLRELRQPDKWLPFASLVDFWWIVVPHNKIVKLVEMPDNWGLLVLGTNGLRAIVKAPRLTTPAGTSLSAHRNAPPIPRGFAAALLRAAQNRQVIEPGGHG